MSRSRNTEQVADVLQTQAAVMDAPAAELLPAKLANPVLPTHSAATRALGSLDVPHASDAFPTGRVTGAPGAAERVAGVAADFGVTGARALPSGVMDLSSGAASVGRVAAEGVGQARAARAPNNVFDLSAAAKTELNPGLEMVKLGLRFEDHHAKKIAELHGEIKKSKEKMDALLKLSTHLQKLPSDQKTHALSDELRAHFTAIREKGIDLLSEDATTLSADQLINVRSTISQHLDSIKTMELQIPLMKSEKFTSELKSLYDSLQKIIQLLNRMIERAQSKVGR